jgi:hypothetical protein
MRLRALDRFGAALAVGVATWLAITLSPGAFAQSTPGPLGATAGVEEDWHAAAVKDVNAAYEIYRQNHPGMLDPNNRDFPAVLERARAAGLQAADTAPGLIGYVRALAAFSHEIGDGHAQAYAKAVPQGSGASQAKVVWPGFLTAWRSGKLVVSYAASDSPAPVGAVILGCDDKDAVEFVKRRLLFNTNFRAGEEGRWWMLAPNSLVTRSDSTTKPVSCRLKTAAGEREIKLSWTEAPSNWYDLMALGTDGERTPIGLTEPRPGVFLIGLQDFEPDDKGAAAYKALFEEVERRHEALSGARAIILDMRYNNGGWSSWSRRLASKLWGENAVEQAMNGYFAGTQIWWRPTDGTLAHLRENEDTTRRRGDIESADAQSRFIAKIAAAQGRGDQFYVQPFGDLPLSARDTRRRTGDLRAPVYIITSGRCASACLDALDTFTRFGNVTLIGAPTSADSTYMEVREEPLPSGHGMLVVPTKMWVNRPRGGGEVYRPDILMDSLDWSTKAFLDRIETYLRARR